MPRTISSCESGPVKSGTSIRVISMTSRECHHARCRKWHGISYRNSPRRTAHPVSWMAASLFSGVVAPQKERRRSSAASFILINVSFIFMSFLVLSVRYPQVAVLHYPERLKDETVWIIVTSCGVYKPSPCHKERSVTLFSRMMERRE